MSLAKLNKCW